jgi:hypothetical protein
MGGDDRVRTRAGSPVRIVKTRAVVMAQIGRNNMATSSSISSIESGGIAVDLLRVIPGIVLLAVIGYAGKFIEHTVNLEASVGVGSTFPLI